VTPIQTSAPALEPISTAEAKNFLRVDSDLTADDLLIAMLVSSARMDAETLTGRSFISQTYRVVFDSFPSMAGMVVPYGVQYSLPANAILLERGPVISVESIIYTAMDSSTQTMPTADYTVTGISTLGDLRPPLARITPVFGKIWPIPLPQIGAVTVNYTAGYGATAAAVPAGIRSWILMRIKSRYDMRGEVAIAGRGKIEPLPWVDNLLNPFCVALA
jgi:uncharacterized phiE125 gp8 family phage protein